MQFILSGVERRDNALKRLHSVAGGTLTYTWDGKSVPVVVGNLHGGSDIQIECRKKNIPYIVIDHGYFERDIMLSVARFCVNSYHCTDWRESDKPIPKVQPYHSGSTIIIIPPSAFAKKIYDVHGWEHDIKNGLRKYTDKKIIIKPKDVGVLSEMLKDCHALVSFGSVSEVEAVIHGVPVFVTKHSPASPISQDIQNIENPEYPERDSWLRSLAASQWKSNEMVKCWDRLKGQLNEHNFIQRIKNSSCELAAR